MQASLWRGFGVVITVKGGTSGIAGILTVFRASVLSSASSVGKLWIGMLSPRLRRWTFLCTAAERIACLTGGLSQTSACKDGFRDPTPIAPLPETCFRHYSGYQQTSVSCRHFASPRYLFGLGDRAQVALLAILTALSDIPRTED